MWPPVRRAGGNTNLIIQLGKMAAIYYLSRDCMKIGHGSNLGIEELEKFYLFNLFNLSFNPSIDR